MQTNPYCGGAAPSEEMMRQSTTPKAYPNKKFYVRKGNVNSTLMDTILSFTSDLDGNFNFKLAPGIYSIIQSSQLKELDWKNYKSNQYTVVDEKCLQAWWAKPYYLLEVKDKDISDLNFIFRHRCFVPGDIPCINYIGPMPP